MPLSPRRDIEGFFLCRLHSVCAWCVSGGVLLCGTHHPRGIRLTSSLGQGPIRLSRRARPLPQQREPEMSFLYFCHHDALACSRRRGRARARRRRPPFGPPAQRRRRVTGPFLRARDGGAAATGRAQHVGRREERAGARAPAAGGEAGHSGSARDAARAPAPTAGRGRTIRVRQITGRLGSYNGASLSGSSDRLACRARACRNAPAAR